MQLRNHRLMSYLGHHIWPPMWIALGGVETKDKFLKGEIGILKETRYYPNRRGRLFLIMDYEGIEYIGCLIFDDAFFCETVANRLHACQGKSIEAVGSLEIYLPRDFISNERINP